MTISSFENLYYKIEYIYIRKNNIKWQKPNRRIETIVAIQRKTMNQNYRYMSHFCNFEIMYAEDTGKKG